MYTQPSFVNFVFVCCQREVNAASYRPGPEVMSWRSTMTSLKIVQDGATVSLASIPFVLFSMALTMYSDSLLSSASTT